MRASTERVITPLERVNASTERVIKPFERVGASTELVIKPFERMQIFFEPLTHGLYTEFHSEMESRQCTFHVRGHIYWTVTKLHVQTIVARFRIPMGTSQLVYQR